MAKDKEQKVQETQEVQVEVPVKESKKQKQESIPEQKKTLGYLISRANYMIKIKTEGKTKFIQPYGRVKVVKESLEIRPNDTIYLTFAKS